MNRYRKKAQRVAERLLQRPLILLRMTGRASTKLVQTAGRLGGVNSENIDTLIRLTRAWGIGDYREVPKASLAALVGALVYFLMPLDAIPDPILALGFLDDIAVLRYALKYARKDLDAFKEWEAQQDALNPSAPPASRQ